LELRRELGWDPDLTTLLIVGSKRVENILSCLQSMDECGYPIQFAVIAGGDDNLNHQLHEIHFQTPVHLYNFVEDLTPMLLASDILISKAGGLIISEGLSAGLPMILIDVIPGQESGNLDYVCSHGAAVTAHSASEIQTIINQWLVVSAESFHSVAQNSRSIGKPDAAFTIAESVWQTLSNP
jgi:1,2-diacylglycerol 3-beta-galactosyltransferase